MYKGLHHFGSRLSTRSLLHKAYELKDHLGNVRVVVSDMKLWNDLNTDNIPDGGEFQSDPIVYNNFYSYHSQEPGRCWNSTNYRYGGADGQEKDDEIRGAGNSYTAKDWDYSPRTGMRSNPDTKPNPSISPYATFAGNPIWFSDVLGDTVRQTSGFQGNKFWQEKYNKWASTKEGEKFLKNYGIGGKYEHISVVFDIGDTGGAGNEGASSVNRKTGKGAAIPVGVVIGNADKLTGGTDADSYLRFTLTFNKNQDIESENETDKAIGVDDVLHETQHLRIDHKTLLSNKATANSYTQHTWMKDAQGSWYKERSSVFKQMRTNWYGDYLKQKGSGKVKDENDYIDKQINDFIK
jgi:hypothetical protein